MPGTESHKTCTRCGETKPLSEYYSGRARCKDCHKAQIYAKRDEDRDAHNTKRRAYTKANPEKIAEQSARHWAKHGEEINAARRAERAKDPEAIRKRDREYWAKNRAAISRTRRLHYWKNRQRLRDQIRVWREANPDKVRAMEDRKRERQKADPLHQAKVRDRNRRYYERNWNEWEKYRQKRRELLIRDYDGWTRKEIYERDGGVCQLCGIELSCTSGGFQIDHIVPLDLLGPNSRANVQLACQPCNNRKRTRLEGQIHLPV